MNAKEFHMVIMFMANVWSERVALDLFGPVMGAHFFSKWLSADHTDLGTMRLFYEMDTEYLQKLIDAAVDHYSSMY